MDIRRYIKHLSKILNINQPKPKIVDNLDTETKMAAVDPQKGVVYIKKGLMSYDKLFAIAHELRHLWQYQNEPNMFAEYANSESLSVEDYNLQIAELDANAFGKIVMLEMFGVKPLFDGLSENVKEKIDEREGIIRKSLCKK